MRIPSRVSKVRFRPSKRGVALLEQIDDAQDLQVVLEAAVGLHAGVQRILAGMAERRMAEVVGERDRFGQVLVEPQAARDRAPDLRHFEAVREPRAEEIAFVVDEDLGLVFEPPEGGGMDDAVAVALVFGAAPRGRLRDAAGHGCVRDRAA